MDDHHFITEVDDFDIEDDLEYDTKLWDGGSEVAIQENSTIKEHEYSQLYRKKILGKCSYKKYGFGYTYYFSLDLKQGRIYMFKKDTNKKPKTYYKLY